jgi:hypothetical protein
VTGARLRAALVAAAALAAVTCTYSGFAPNGAQRCAAVGLKRCADGYHCAVDETCWQDGSDPPPRADAAARADALFDAAERDGAGDASVRDARAAGDVGQPDAAVDGTAGGDGPAIDAGSDAVDASPPGPGCPPDLPSAGDPCSPLDQLCSYGTAPRPECRDRATCTASGWMVLPSTCPGLFVSSPCPANPPLPSDYLLCPGAEVGNFCRYATASGAGIECRCVGNPDTMGNVVCAYPIPPPAPCPPMLPNAGTACGEAPTTCSYPCFGLLYSSSVTATCAEGTWSWTLRNCSSS